ncbi:DNA replication/repair protein RecF [Ligilactobacillus salivarius]|uniref:DNA replication/repair protein RecF n=1 Tax=Ligilactobacillus salivarius TaxID=1624 RepID=UPI003AB86B6F
MYLEKLELKHFRNYEDVNVAFSPQVNVLIGKNAQGKTNLLESIYVLAMARSHRTSNDREMVTFKEDAALIRGEVHQRLGNTKLELLISRKGKKAKVNHLEKARLSQYIGQLNVILFAPEDLALVKGAPSVRRRFIDMEFGQIDALYLHTLTEYRAVLRQRNKYLKELQTKKATDKVYLEILSEQLSESGSQIIFKRLEFLQELEKYADKLHNQITQGKEHLQFQYESTLKEYQGKSVLELKQSLIEQYKTMMDKEIFQGTTLLGPHRDDVRFMLNDKNVQVYGSQGQQRTAALSVKLAEIDLMKEKTHEYPILLLDDVLSELDGARQTHLLKTIQNKVQTFLTTPGLSDVAQQLINKPKIFRIDNGKITEENSFTIEEE